MLRKWRIMRGDTLLEHVWFPRCADAEFVWLWLIHRECWHGRWITVEEAK